MKVKTHFMKWYHKLPKIARRDLVWQPYGKHPMSLQVLWMEIANETELGKEALKKMGWEK